MYSNELSAEKEDNIAALFVGWLYYFERNPVSSKDHDYRSQHELAKLLLDYAPSVHRDHQYVTFYQQQCLRCHDVHHCCASIMPYGSTCASCCGSLSPVVTATITDMREYWNPMTIVFGVLPCTVQRKIFQRLLDYRDGILDNREGKESLCNMHR